MNSLKKLIFTAIFCFSSTLFALPGVTPYLPDDSGLYVFYRDASFKRTSFVGFLQYDEKNFAMRYYAPAVDTKTEKQSATSVDILFTVDPSLDFLKMTGERFLHPVANADTEIVNYLHDLVVELAKHRKNLPSTWNKNRTQTITYSDSSDLFGTLVNMQFDCYVPLFNLRRMLGSNQKPIFELLTAGKLEGDDDNSFWDFTGFPQKDVAAHPALTLNRTQKTALWEQKAPTIWLLQDAAIFSANESAIPPNMQTMSFNLWDYFKRLFLLSARASYTDWKKISIEQNQSMLQIFSYRYDQKNALIYDVKILHRSPQAEKLQIISLVVYKNDYDKNAAYFKKIIADCVASNGALDVQKILDIQK
ncbi:MAG: hypothetical protein Ta2A_08050 [Treponemataceae bacterium]|nr:MAG: hypothetical protein Ta2A_08050 [Treponemataceae bacterium]